MSVTFNRNQLIKVARQALKEHEAARGVRVKAIAEWKANHQAKNYDADKIRRLRDFLTARLKKGGPITRNEVRKATNNGYDIEGMFYSAPDAYQIEREVTATTGLLTPAQVIETNSLLKVLEAATGDTVSANELKLLGLKNLGPVFAAAAAQNGKQVGA